MSTEPLPKWEMKKYSLLWKRFGYKNFTNQLAQQVLKEKDNHILSVLFYDLKRLGWVKIKRDEKDKRRKVYTLKEPNQAVKEMVY